MFFCQTSYNPSVSATVRIAIYKCTCCFCVGPEYKGCEEGSGEPTEICQDSAYGCCPDKLTPATGPNEEGCNDISVVTPPVGGACELGEFGCCPDGKTAATGKYLTLLMLKLLSYKAQEGKNIWKPC